MTRTTDNVWLSRFALLTAFATLVLICFGGLVTSHWFTTNSTSPQSSLAAPRGLRRLVLFTTTLLFAQLVLGATMRHQHAGLAIPDFPAAYRRLWPALDAESVARYNQNRVEVYA